MNSESSVYPTTARQDDQPSYPPNLFCCQRQTLVLKYPSPNHAQTPNPIPPQQQHRVHQTSKWDKSPLTLSQAKNPMQ